MENARQARVGKYKTKSSTYEVSFTDGGELILRKNGSISSQYFSYVSKDNVPEITEKLKVKKPEESAPLLLKEPWYERLGGIFIFYDGENFLVSSNVIDRGSLNQSSLEKKASSPAPIQNASSIKREPYSLAGKKAEKKILPKIAISPKPQQKTPPIPPYKLKNPGKIGIKNLIPKFFRKHP